MNVSLSEEWEDFIAATVGSGRYNSASEVIRAALRLLQDDEHDRRLEQLAVEALDSGEVRKITKADIASAREAVRQKILKRGAAGGE